MLPSLPSEGERLLHLQMLMGFLLFLFQSNMGPLFPAMWTSWRRRGGASFSFLLEIAKTFPSSSKQKHSHSLYKGIGTSPLFFIQTMKNTLSPFKGDLKLDPKVRTLTWLTRCRPASRKFCMNFITNRHNFCQTKPKGHAKGLPVPSTLSCGCTEQGSHWSVRLQHERVLLHRTAALPAYVKFATFTLWFVP